MGLVTRFSSSWYIFLLLLYGATHRPETDIDPSGEYQVSTSWVSTRPARSTHAQHRLSDAASSARAAAPQASIPWPQPGPRLLYSILLASLHWYRRGEVLVWGKARANVGVDIIQAMIIALATPKSVLFLQFLISISSFPVPLFTNLLVLSPDYLIPSVFCTRRSYVLVCAARSVVYETTLWT